MELYGSLSNISGSVTASAFTGSFIGDGSGLSGIQAAGVTGLNLSQISTGSVSASLSSDGFNVNTGTSITGSLNVSGTVISQTTPLVSGSSQIEITGTTGYSTFSSSFATTDSNQESRLNSIETSTGSLNSFTSSIDTTIKNKLNTDNVISGSIQVDITGTTGYSTFSSSISSSIGDISSSIATTTNNLSTSIASTDLSQTNRLISIESKTGSYATTGSNLFIGTQTHSGSILPSVDNAYDLGSPTYQWRDVYISSGSLYIDGTKVLSSTAQELTITTDTGQSIKILEGTTDSIILQTADGDIELKSSADGDILLDPTYGKIMLKGTIEVFNGNKIQSSVGGTPVVFANDIVVSGSIELTGTVDGIDLTAFSSSLNGRLGSLESSGGSLNEFTSSAISRLNVLETTTSSLNTYTSSNNTRLGVIETTTSSLNTYTSSADGRLSSIETTTGSILSVNTTQNGRLDSLETTSGSILSVNTTQNGRLDSIEGKTGSYATTGSNIFQGNQIITGSLFVSQDLIIAGSSSIQNISSSVLNIADNIITVNAVNPSVRFGGLAVIDSGSSPQLSGSLLFDSVKNEWIFVHQNQGTVTSSVLLMGPETYDNLGNEAYITANRLVKSTGIEHLTNSNISDDGTTVTILSNAVVNGTFSATGTTLVSGSSQISHDSTTGYVANRHIDHTSVSISAGNGLSGGGDISTTRTLTLDTSSATFTSGVKSKMNADGVVSGSSQVSFNGITDKPTLVSGSSQITYGSLSGIPSGIVSGSSQITFGSISGIPSGLVSGSSQIDLTATTNYSSGIKTRLNAEGVLSGSSQVVAALPNGTVSGSLQVSYTGLSNIPSGIVSGSSQITFGSISSIPSGLVSGSSQITLSSTTGYGSVLNQAVLTSSTPTFAGVTSTAQISAGYSNASEPFVNGHFFNTSGTPGTQYGGVLLSGVQQAHLRFLVGTNTWGGAGAKQWQIRVGNGNGSDDMRIYSWTAGRDITTFKNDGAIITYDGGNAGGFYLSDTNAGLYRDNTYDVVLTQNNSSGAVTYISGAGNVIVSLDNNNNETDRKFIVGSNAVKATNELFSVNESGNGYFSGNLSTVSYMLVGGSYGNNAYASVSSTRLFFGGGDSDAVSNYYIGTNMENVGGNYTKLDLRWHTGIRMGAQPGYGGIRFFDTEDLGTVLFSIGNTDGNVRSHTNLIPSANNSYNLGTSSLRWANLYTNDLHLSNEGKEGGNEIDGTTGNWTIQEGEENLYIINNKNGKKFKIDLTEIV
jgi:hypothetical protein